MTWSESKQYYLDKGVTECKVVNVVGARDRRCTETFDELHHGIFPGQKSKTTVAWRKFLDDKINGVPSCHSCNTNRVGDPFFARYAQFHIKLIEFGLDAVRTWLSTATSEIKRRREWKIFWKATK